MDANDRKSNQMSSALPHTSTRWRRLCTTTGLILLLGLLGASQPQAASLSTAYSAFQQGKFAQAKAILGTLRKGSGAPAGIAWLGGHIAYAQKQYSAASLAYQRALRTCAKNQKPWLHNDIGNTFYQQKQWRRAIHHYAKALSQKPGYERARYNLELALRKLQKKKKQPPPPPRRNQRPPPPPPPRKNRKKKRRKPPKRRPRGLKPHKSPPKVPKRKRFRLKPFDRFLPYSRVLRHRKAQGKK